MFNCVGGMSEYVFMFGAEVVGGSGVSECVFTCGSGVSECLYVGLR